jgi:hypothetical protein
VRAFARSMVAALVAQPGAGLRKAVRSLVVPTGDDP